MTDTAEKRFARLATKFLDDPRVNEGTGFGSSPGLTVGGKIFAMLIDSELVVKLPREQIDMLVEDGVGQRLQTGKNRPMREWLRVPIAHSRRWPRLAGDAYAFVGCSGVVKRVPKQR